MNESDRQLAISTYLQEVTDQFYSGHAKEHAYRPALERLMMSFEDTHAVNDPKRSENGNPDFVFLKKSNQKIIKGYAEAKDIDVSLDKTEKTNQMERYGGYANLFLTDYLEFRFFRNGEKYETISLGHVKDGNLYKTPENSERLMRELEAFLTQAPERIRSGKRLAQIMGGKARRVRDNVAQYLKSEDEKSAELIKIYEMMKKMLVHDLTEEKFADMYAQTLVYGLFVARYGDATPESFDRQEARDLVPKSNPFLRQFFDHIAGPSFDIRLGYIVDELCEVFSVSDVQDIVHKHLRIQDTTNDAKDPIIHFYEDFLQEYDPAERKRMGAYYTPIPVVKYIVRQVDRILKEEFNISQGLASTETIQYQVETGQDLRHDRRTKAPTHQSLTVPRVQVLDPAVGTATFLNETIKFIHEGFKGQEGRWPSYVNDNLLKRLHGFELMMAPYTIAHLKLGMTLRETGVDKLNERLGVYLTNTLEEGIPHQPDLFSFGLAEAVSEESRLAAEVKSERPVMVVMGNPPYSGVSSNETKFANALINKYKVEPGNGQKLQERNYKWINNDYVKFIAFAQNMVLKNGEGIVAMITDNSYLDSPTFRGMRYQLACTFDKIYILDLHGNSNKQEVSPDGSKEENIFDIKQGVSIILAVKKAAKSSADLAEIYHSELYGPRKEKFRKLEHKTEWRNIVLDKQFYSFVPRDTYGLEIYSKSVSLTEIFASSSIGIASGADKVLTAFTKPELDRQINHAIESDSSHRVAERLRLHYANENNQKGLLAYRPFDSRYFYYNTLVVERMRDSMTRHMLHENIALCFTRKIEGTRKFADCFVVSMPIQLHTLSIKEGNYFAPLYIYRESGERVVNLNANILPQFTQQLEKPYYEYPPENILDYIYAILHSPSYREKNKEFLKIDFPRVPIPTQAEFDRLVPLGRELRELHLMKSPLLGNYLTTYPIAGDDTVEKLSYSDEKVWINEMQYFGNVPETAWNFYIGGYQPAQKWLKDRKGRKLTSEDLEHYQKIIKILLETDRIMREIDNVD